MSPIEDLVRVVKIRPNKMVFHPIFIWNIEELDFTSEWLRTHSEGAVHEDCDDRQSVGLKYPVLLKMGSIWR